MSTKHTLERTTNNLPLDCGVREAWELLKVARRVTVDGPGTPLFLLRFKFQSNKQKQNKQNKTKQDKNKTKTKTL
jgi:hypothetical protein